MAIDRCQRQSGLTKPLFMGGGVTARNVGNVLQSADGVIVSRAFKRQEYRDDEIVRWDTDKLAEFMEAAWPAGSANS